VIILAFLLLSTLMVWGIRVLIRRLRARLLRRADMRARVRLQGEADELRCRGSATTR
jgi:hypothetical protein